MVSYFLSSPVWSVASYLGVSIGYCWRVAFAVPLGLFAGIFLAELCPPRGKEIRQAIVELLADIPSCLAFGVLVVAPFIRDFLSFYRSHCFHCVFDFRYNGCAFHNQRDRRCHPSVPRSYKEASLALGATAGRLCVKWFYLLPLQELEQQSFKRGRIIGETMAV